MSFELDIHAVGEGSRAETPSRYALAGLARRSRGWWLWTVAIRRTVSASWTSSLASTERVRSI